jgi:hypothetical protein
MADEISEVSDVTTKKLNTLARQEGGPAVSIYMPLQTPSAKASVKHENMIRLKNLLRRAEDESKAYTRDHPESEGRLSALLQPLRDAYDAGDRFWDPQAVAIAIFLAPGTAEVLALQAEVSEEVVINDRFHLKPLISAHTMESRFYLVSLDMHDVKLFRGNASKMQEIPFVDGPPELPEILKEFSFERTLNKAPGTGTIYVGHAGGEENLSPHIVEFIEGVDGAVRATLKGTELPVLLAGTENVVGQYRHHSHIRTLLQEYVQGSPRSMSVRDLHAKAWRIISRRQEKKIADEVSAVAEALESDQGARELSDICRAAYEGRLQILLVAQDTEVHGSFDPEREVLDMSDSGEDLLDLAAHYAWTRGTRVYALPQERIPGGRVAAGVVHPA